MSKKVIIWTGIKIFFGLMFKIPKEDEIYVLDLREEKLVDVHTFFCLKYLDIILLNKNLEVVEEHRNVRPFKIIFPKRKFRYIVEGLKLGKEDLDLVRKVLSK